MAFLRLKQILIIFTLTALFATGCGRDASEIRDERTPNAPNIVGAIAAAIPAEEEAEEEMPLEEEEAEEEIATPTPDPQTYAPVAKAKEYSGQYKRALDAFKETLTLPDGTKAAPPTDYDFIYSEYAYEDVDLDGKDELIINYSDGEDEMPVLGVYEYDPNNEIFNCELMDMPGAEFFENGVVRVPWPNEESLNPDIESYNIYQYNKDTDVFDYVGFVQSWDKSYFAADFEGIRFPSYKDKDEDGVIYSLQIYDEYDYGFVYDVETVTEIEKRFFNSRLIRPSWFGL